MLKGRKTPIQIEQEGAPRVADSYAAILAEGENVVALSLDFSSKYCEVGVTGSGNTRGPLIYICATPESRWLNEAVEREKPTIVSFPEFQGWTVWCANFGRYALHVCLIRLELS